MIRDFFQKLFSSRHVTARHCSAAIGGDNYGAITINNGLGDKQYNTIVQKIGDLGVKIDQNSSHTRPSDSTASDPLEQHLDAQIDSISELIKQRKPISALQLLESLYERVGATASGRIRFRIKANMGICQYLQGDDKKTAELLLDAYVQAPTEPKAISNKVLALILQHRWQEAFDFAHQKISKHKDNEELAGYLIQAARHIDATSNPIEIIPPLLHNRPAVLVGCIIYSQGRGLSSDWWPIAIAGAQAFPDDTTLRYFSAVAKIDNILQSQDFKRTHILSLANQKEISAAAAILRTEWESRLIGEAKLRTEDTPCANNLLIAYLLLGDNESITTVAEQAIAKFSSVAELMECVANATAQSGNFELARKAVSRAGDTPTVRFIRFQIATQSEDPRELGDIDESTLADFPEIEQKCARTIIEIAKLKSIGGVASSEQLHKILARASDDARALIILANEAEKLDQLELSQIAYQKSLEVVGDHIAERMMVANTASKRRDWQQVIKMLDGFVSKDKDNHGLWLLAQAFSHILPVQEIAIRFFETLPNEILDKPHFMSLCGMLYYNYGDLDLAEHWISKAYQASSTDIRLLLSLTQVYTRKGNESSVQKLLTKLDLSMLEGMPIDKIFLAQLLIKHGRVSDAIPYAYKVLCENRRDADVAKEYAGLILLSPDEVEIPSSETVKPGFWFSLVNQHGEPFTCIADDGEKIPGEDTISIEHPLVASALGLRVGDGFEQKHEFGTVHWTITEIKHKYLYALHDIMHNYSTRFPDKHGLYAVSLPEKGDITPILDIVKKHSERQSRVVESYFKQQIPLSFIANINKKDTISFAQLVIQHGHKITTGTGNIQEFSQAVDTFKSNDINAAVLDSYTAWHAACADLFPMLKKAFQEIVIAQSSLDEIYSILIDLTSSSKSPTMSLSWHNGQFYPEEHTDESVNEKVAYIKSQCDKIESFCTISPVAWRSEPNNLAKEVLNLAGPHYWDAAYLASQGGRILLSDDLYYRQWAHKFVTAKHSTWLYVVLKHLLNENIIRHDDYAKAITHLALWRHDYLSVDSATLLNVLKLDNTEQLLQFSAVADFIGVKNAEWISHLNVCKEFFNTIWANSFEHSLKTGKATGILLNKFFRHCPNWAIFFLYIYFMASPTLKEYMDCWRIGHLLPKHDIDSALKRLEHAQMSSQ